jgi:hypothetical protein
MRLNRDFVRPNIPPYPANPRSWSAPPLLPCKMLCNALGVGLVEVSDVIDNQGGRDA